MRSMTMGHPEGHALFSKLCYNNSVSLYLYREVT